MPEITGNNKPRGQGCRFFRCFITLLLPINVVTSFDLLSISVAFLEPRCPLPPRSKRLKVSRTADFVDMANTPTVRKNRADGLEAWTLTRYAADAQTWNIWERLQGCGTVLVQLFKSSASILKVLWWQWNPKSNLTIYVISYCKFCHIWPMHLSTCFASFGITDYQPAALRLEFIARQVWPVYLRCIFVAILIPI